MLLRHDYCPCCYKIFDHDNKPEFCPKCGTQLRIIHPLIDHTTTIEMDVQLQEELHKRGLYPSKKGDKK